MADYFYSNVAVSTTLSGSISAGDTAITVVSATGFPGSFPYILAVDYEGTTEELVSVTAAAGTSLTVTRGFGGTSAQSHSLGAAVRHVANAQDFTDFRTHEDGGTAVHGLTGDVVGTTDTQTLTNKTLTAPTVTAPAITGGGTLDGSFTGEPVFADGLGMGTITVNETFGFFSTGDAAYMSARALATDEAFIGRQDGDATNRFEIKADGAMEWGNGTDARDVTLYRDDVDTLITDGQLLFDRPTEAHDIIQARVAGDAGLRFGIEANGDMFWGDGTDLTLDAGLARTGLNTLAATARFSADVETSTTFTTTSGFSLIAARHRKTCGVATVSIQVNVDSTISTTGFAGNITDTAFGTLPPGYRPADRFDTNWSNGFVSGSALITEDGVIQLRTSDAGGDIESGTSLTVSATYVL